MLAMITQRQPAENTLAAKAQSWDREKTDEVVQRLMKNHPDYYPAHQARAEALMPRWGAERGELETYAQQVADRIGGQAGNEVYVRIADQISNYHRPPN